ncbi:MAG TPA: PAS domain S-box protein [Burkholderiales bacterium]|nr:PAS domain S-box protein [Burkholderiales bacterium]
MNDPAPLRNIESALEAVRATYAGRTRYTQLEHEALLANASIGIAFTRDKRFFLCNPKFAEMFGYRADELVGQSGEVLYTSRDSYSALGQIAVPLLAAGRQLDIEWELRRRDGSTVLCRVVAKAIDDKNPQQGGTVWIVDDVTERRRHADEVARLAREQEAILGSASIGIVFLQDRKVVRCNRRYEEMYGYAPGELIGKPISILYANPEDFATAPAAYDLLARGQTARRVQLRRRKDGTTLWSRGDGRAVDPHDPMKGSVWIVEDVTEQRRGEEELQRVLAEQQALLNNVVVGIAFSLERKIVRCNRRFEELFGFAPGGAIGASWREAYFTEDEFEARQSVYAELDQGLIHTREQWLRRQDGSGFWCRVTARAVAAGHPAKGYVWLVDDISERKRADQALERIVREQDAVLQNTLAGIAFIKDRIIVRCNRRFEEMFGYGPGELLDQTTRFMFRNDAEFAAAGGEAVYETVWAGGTQYLEREHVRKDGSRIWCSLSGRAVQPDDPSQGSVWLLDDITQEHEAEERVQRALAEQELILDNATVGIAFLRNRVILRCNRYFEEMMGAGPGELVGQSTTMLFASKEEWKRAGRQSDKAQPGESFEGEARFKRRDGSTFICRVRGRRIDTGDAEQEWIWSYDDVTAEREADARVRSALESLERAVADRTTELEEAKARAQHLADHDALTGLPNRRLLEDRLTQALAMSQRNREHTAVMFVDLDRFKTINDSLGHAVGDVLLKEVSRRLVEQLRTGDTICRIGGDEFVLVLPQIKRTSDVAQVAQKVIEQLSLPLMVEERELVVTPSIGIAVFPEDGRDAETLIRNADAAMYHAKEAGRANYQFFTEQMNQAASRRLALESDLRRALSKGELRVHYQRFADTAGSELGKTAGHEALLRWQHPERGLVLPGDFIQLAEETGLILRMGEWVLREACRWATFIGAEHGLQVAVNLSPRQFNDPHLPRIVAAALKESGLPPRLLELEITESLAMRETDTTLATLKKLKQLGVSIAIDDFGTGYSSLAYLKRFPVDKLKIDRTFVAELPKDREQCAIVSAIVALAHALNVRVIAEGVETKAQREFLARCGCDFVQGYLVGKPLEADAAAKEYL